MKLSEHFTLAEFTISNIAARMGIDNTPGELVLENLRRLAGVLEQVRALLGHPIYITSGYRCEELNRLVGGSQNSKHISGLAADFVCPGFGTAKAVVAAIACSDISFDQCILEYFNPSTGQGWCHLGLSDSHRRQVLTINRRGVFAGVMA